MADAHAAARVSEWPQEDVERVARALFDAGSGPTSDVRPGDWERWRTTYTVKARAVLSSIEAVPKAEYERVRAMIEWRDDHEVCDQQLREAEARAESAEARCKSYRAALETLGLEVLRYLNGLHANEDLARSRLRDAATVALEASVPADREPVIAHADPAMKDALRGRSMDQVLADAEKVEAEIHSVPADQEPTWRCDQCGTEYTANIGKCGQLQPPCDGTVHLVGSLPEREEAR